MFLEEASVVGLVGQFYRRWTHLARVLAVKIWDISFLPRYIIAFPSIRVDPVVR